MRHGVIGLWLALVGSLVLILGIPYHAEAQPDLELGGDVQKTEEGRHEIDFGTVIIMHGQAQGSVTTVRVGKNLRLQVEQISSTLRTLLIQNLGNKVLKVLNFEFEGKGSFFLDQAPPRSFELKSGQLEKAVIEFAPKFAGEHRGFVFISTNDPDPDEKETEVDLKGKAQMADGLPDLVAVWEKVAVKQRGRKAKAVLTVSNIGKEETGSFKVKVFLSEDDQLSEDDREVREKEIVLLEGGESRRVRVEVRGRRREKVTGKFLIAVVDAEGEVTEGNEENNLAVTEI